MGRSTFDLVSNQIHWLLIDPSIKQIHWLLPWRKDKQSSFEPCSMRFQGGQTAQEQLKTYCYLQTPLHCRTLSKQAPGGVFVSVPRQYSAVVVSLLNLC